MTEQLKEYHEIVKQVDDLFKDDYTDLNVLVDRIQKLERLKYRITYWLIEFEAQLLTEYIMTLENMLSQQTKYRKVLDSSTLTKDVLNASNVNLHARYKKMQEYLRNMRGSIETTRTLISLEKQLPGVQGYST